MELKGSQPEAMQVHKNRPRILTTEDVDSCPTRTAGKNVFSPDSNMALGSCTEKHSQLLQFSG